MPEIAELARLCDKADKATSTNYSSGCQEEKECHNNLNYNYNYKLGTCISVAFVFCVSGGAACAQVLGGSVPTFQLNMWRFVAQLLIVLPVIIVKGVTVLPGRKHIPWIAATCLAYNLYNILYYTAIIHLPLGAIAGISRGFTLIVVSGITAITLMLDWCWASVADAGPTAIQHWADALCSLGSVVLCTTGMVLIAQPEFMFHGTVTSRPTPHGHHPLCQESQDDHKEDALLYNMTSANTTTGVPHNVINSVVSNETLGYTLLLLSSVAFSAIYFIANRKLMDSSSTMVSFWVAVAGVVPSAVLMLLFEDFTIPGTTTCLVLLAGHAFGTGAGTPLNQTALRYIPPIMVSLITCSQVVLMCIAQYTFMKNVNPGKGNAAEIAGIVVVFTGIVLGPLYKMCLHMRPSSGWHSGTCMEKVKLMYK